MLSFFLNLHVLTNASRLKISNAIDRLFTAVKNKTSSRLVLTMIELDDADQRYILPFLISRSKNVKLLTIDYQIPINWKDDIFSVSRTSFEFVFSSFCPHVNPCCYFGAEFKMVIASNGHNRCMTN